MIEQLWNDPVSEAKMTKYIEALELQNGQRVLDVGCGCGEVLIRIQQRYRIHGTGIDNSSEHIAEANRRAAELTVGDTLQFIEADAQSFQVDSESLDLAICMGSSHAFGMGSNALQNAVERMIQLIVPGGLLIVAEGYMKQPASAEYRKLLGDSMPDEMTHAANVDTGKQLGLIPLAAWTSSEDEWDDFEWTYQRLVEQKAAESPEGSPERERLVQRRQWIDAYLNWGRDTLGYGIYLFKRSETESA